MKNKAHIIIAILGSGFFLLLDQFLKYFARANVDFVYYLWKPWIGWEYFANNGIAFSLPVPNWLVVVVTPLILLGLLGWLLSLRGGARATTKQSLDNFEKIINKNLTEIASSADANWLSRNDISIFSTFLVIAGALSNYIDRLFFGATIDYLRLFTGVINLADVMIVGGVMLMIVGECKKKNSTPL